MKTLQAVIPFAGFYESCHAEFIDRECEYITQDSNGHKRPDIAERFYREFGYTSAMLEAYAREYVSAWKQAAGIDCEFHHVDSPRYYNFETDRIFVTLTGHEAARLKALVDPEKLQRIATTRHTSRSGFISYYSPNVETWGPVDTWDPEPLHTLILASLPEDMPEEFDLMEYAMCNGVLANIVWDHMSDEARRIANIADYLRVRADRKYRK